MTMTDTDVYIGPADDIDEIDPSEAVDPLHEPETRLDELKRQLAAEYERVIEAKTSELDELTQQLDTLTDRKKTISDEVRTLRADIARLTGQRAPTEEGEHRCKVPDCGRTFGTQQGLRMHTTRSHKTTPTKPTPAPSTGSSSRTVYRCGDCDTEVATPKDLAHHTLTQHRRQPTQGEKILVTPDAAR
jgi:uncharacterized C2H2 Zn-finger protein